MPNLVSLQFTTPPKLWDYSSDRTPREVVSDIVLDLIGCYRKGEAEDPGRYVRAVATVMERYPEVVLRTVVDPFIGLPSKSDWLPTIAEVKRACESVAAEIAEVKVLQIPPPERPASPEQRERAVAAWERAKADILASNVLARD